MTKKRRAASSSPSSSSSAHQTSSAAATVAMSSSPFPYPSSPMPATPPRTPRSTLARVSSLRSGVAASTRSQLSVAQLPVLSPPLKKRVTGRRNAKAVKLQLPRDDNDRDDAEADGDMVNGYTAKSYTPNPDREASSCCGGTRAVDPSVPEGEETVQALKPDPYLPEAYQRDATVLRHGDSFYNAMLTRVRCCCRFGARCCRCRCSIATKTCRANEPPRDLSVVWLWLIM